MYERYELVLNAAQSAEQSTSLCEKNRSLDISCGNWYSMQKGPQKKKKKKDVVVYCTLRSMKIIYSWGKKMIN